MIRLAKYLKPYLAMILLSIALLFVQANADLALPDYLSRIVNNGIQQGGVENAVPTAIRATTMNRLTFFLGEDEQARVLAAYARIDNASPAYAETLLRVPGLAKEPVYTLKTVGADEIAWLNPVLGKALLAVSGLEGAMTDPAKLAQMSKALGFDLSKLPAGSDLFAVLGKAPASARSQISAAMQQQFAELEEKAIQQAAVRVVKAEYEALGMDAVGLQTRYILRVGLLMLLVTLLSVACTVAVSYFSAKAAAGLGRDLRRGDLPEGGELLQHRVRSLFDRLVDHPHHQRRDPDPDVGDDVDPYGLLRADHGRRRHHPGDQQRLLDVVDHRRGRGDAPRPGGDRLLVVAAEVQDHADLDRPAEPGDARESVGHDGHPGLQHAAL